MRNMNIEVRPLIFDNLLVYETKQLNIEEDKLRRLIFVIAVFCS